SRRLIIAVSFTSAVARLGTCCLCVSLTYFFFKCYAVPRDQHSFPTRRSSDLIRPVLLLRAKPASLDDDDAVLGGALPRELERAFAHPFRQAGRVGRVEAELHGGGDLVDVLAAGAGRADELLLKLVCADLDARRDMQSPVRVHGRCPVSEPAIRAGIT